jgi:hypothetical protein
VTLHSSGRAVRDPQTDPESPFWGRSHRPLRPIPLATGIRSQCHGAPQLLALSSSPATESFRRERPGQRRAVPLKACGTRPRELCTSRSARRQGNLVHPTHPGLRSESAGGARRNAAGTPVRRLPVHLYRQDPSRPASEVGRSGTSAQSGKANFPKHPCVLVRRQRVPVGCRVPFALRVRGPFRLSRRESTRYESRHLTLRIASKHRLVEPCARHDSNMRPLPPLSHAPNAFQRQPFQQTA